MPENNIIDPFKIWNIGQKGHLKPINIEGNEGPYASKFNVKIQ